MTRAGVACLGCAEHLDPHASRYRLDLLPDGDSKKQGRAVGYLCCGCERILVKALRRMRSDRGALLSTKEEPMVVLATANET